MADKSKIEWTDATWNPVRGCTKVSPGCANCYAETFAERFRGVQGHPYEQGFDLRLVPAKLTEPLRWMRPRHVFVNSMSDLFHDDVPDEYIVRVADVMRRADWHTFQVLTKRSERMRDLLNGPLSDVAHLNHIWWGVSVENRKHGVPRIEHIRTSSALVRFLSVEPLLEDLGQIDLSGVSWVIVGGESGARARPMHPSWARSVRDQCVAAGVPFFFKQWGAWGLASQHPQRITRVGSTRSVSPFTGKDDPRATEAETMIRVGKGVSGRLLDGQTWDELPQVLTSS